MLAGIFPREQFQLEYDITDATINLFSDSRVWIINGRAYHHFSMEPKWVSGWSNWVNDEDYTIYRKNKKRFDSIAEEYDALERSKGNMPKEEFVSKEKEIINATNAIFERKRGHSQTRREIIDTLLKMKPLSLSGTKILRSHNWTKNGDAVRAMAKSICGRCEKSDGSFMSVSYNDLNRAVEGNADDFFVQNIADLPKIIKNATYVCSLPNVFLDTKEIVRFNQYICSTQVYGRDFTARLVETVFDDGKCRFYDMRLTDMSIKDIVNGNFTLHELDHYQNKRGQNNPTSYKSSISPEASGQSSNKKVQRASTFSRKDKITICLLQDSFEKDIQQYVRNIPTD